MSEDNLISQQDKCFLRLKSLIKVSAQVSSSLDLDCVLQSIVETSQEVMRSEASSLMLYNPEKDVLEFTIALGSTANQVKGFTVKPGQGIAGWVFQNGKSVLIKDAQNDERFYNQVDDQTGFITHSMAFVPLRNQEKSIGVLVAINSLDQKCFNEDDLDLLWDSLINMFDHDHSAARGKMCARKLVVFQHESALGNAPAHKLFETITVKPCDGKPPRSFSDYSDGISAPTDGPLDGFSGVTVMNKL